MALEREELVAELRERAGGPSPEELESSVIDKCVTAALIEYSRLRPIRREVSIEIHEGVSEYPVDPEVISVPTFEFTFGSEPSLAHTVVSDLGPFSDIAVTPSLYVIEAMRRKARRKAEGYTWRFDDANHKLVISPTPKTRGFGAYVGIVSRKLEQVRPDHEELLKKYALAEVLRALANKRSQVTGVPTGSGTIQMTGYQDLLKEAEELRKEFYRKLGGGSPMLTG